MREIKFRAWNKETKCFFYWDTSFAFGGTGEIWGNIEQFTGLHDKNGKEIYFNDFVKAPSGNIFQVIWYDEEMRIALKFQDTIYNFNVTLYEVCGNIHQNPELMK